LIRDRCAVIPDVGQIPVMSVVERPHSPVRRVLQMLANGAYEAPAELTNGERLSADEIRQSIADYGRKVATPPEDAYEHIDAIEIRGSHPRSWSARVPLWTEEEGRSDLTPEMTITELATDVRIETDDIHVL
jgi:hypothetical protein